MGKYEYILTPEVLLATLVKASGNYTQAAKLVGVHKDTFMKYLKRYPDVDARAKKELRTKVLEHVEKSRDIIDSCLNDYEMNPRFALEAAKIVIRQTKFYERHYEEITKEDPGNTGLSNDEADLAWEQYLNGKEKQADTDTYIIPSEETEYEH